MGTTVSISSKRFSFSSELSKGKALEQGILSYDDTLRHETFFFDFPDGWKVFEDSRESNVKLWYITNEELERKWLLSSTTSFINDETECFLYRIGGSMVCETYLKEVDLQSLGQWLTITVV